MPEPILLSAHSTRASAACLPVVPPVQSEASEATFAHYAVRDAPKIISFKSRKFIVMVTALFTQWNNC